MKSQEKGLMSEADQTKGTTRRIKEDQDQRTLVTISSALSARKKDILKEISQKEREMTQRDMFTK